jgi:hypothetical protein
VLWKLFPKAQRWITEHYITSSMNKPTLHLTAAFSLIMNALSATAAPKLSHGEIPISSLPFAITAPGTYVLTGNLTAGQLGIAYPGALLIAKNIQGPVVVDLKGFAITSTYATAISIGSYGAPLNTYPITIKNGTISGGLCTNPGNIPSPATELTIDNVTFVGQTGILFVQTSNSTVKNCTFQNGGIGDYDSPGGNRYLNLTFINNTNGALFVGPYNGRYPYTGPGSVLTLEDCEFASPQ